VTGSPRSAWAERLIRTRSLVDHTSAIYLADVDAMTQGATLGPASSATVAPRERTEFVLRLLRRAEPALLVGVALHTGIHVLAHDGPIAYVVRAAASLVLGVAGLVRPTNDAPRCCVRWWPSRSSSPYRCGRPTIG
jgi:hypothetical protein